MTIGLWLGLGLFFGLIMVLVIVLFKQRNLNKQIIYLKQEVMNKNGKEKEEFFGQRIKTRGRGGIGEYWTGGRSGGTTGTGDGTGQRRIFHLPRFGFGRRSGGTTGTATAGAVTTPAKANAIPFPPFPTITEPPTAKASYNGRGNAEESNSIGIEVRDVRTEKVIERQRNIQPGVFEQLREIADNPKQDSRKLRKKRKTVELHKPADI